MCCSPAHAGGLGDAWYKHSQSISAFWVDSGYETLTAWVSSRGTHPPPKQPSKKVCKNTSNFGKGPAAAGALGTNKRRRQ